jgi:hypothetical protein
MKLENLVINKVDAFISINKKPTIRIRWSANIGFGEIELFWEKRKKCFTANTECLGKNFVNIVIDKFKENLIIEE